jgi:hypothetical protein
MHIVAIGYPPNPTYAQKRAAKEFYESLTQLIPCPMCREHYSEHLQKNPITPALDRREDLFNWTITVHNEVNKKLGKPRVLEVEALKFYKRLGERNLSPVITQTEFDEIDLRSILRGALIGSGVTFTTILFLWLCTRYSSKS